VESPEEAARICHLKWVLGLEGGVLVANPIPAEHALDETLVDRVLADAMIDAHAAGITGKLVTPFLGARINELTGGMSLKANVAIMRNNATLAARIAAALVAMEPLGS
jgi:pseudouridylate synthase